MESLSFIPLTLASILSSFSTDASRIEEAVISTHTSPEIAGLWELDIQETPDFVLPSSKLNSADSKGTVKDEDLENLILAIQESSRIALEAESAADEVKSVENANFDQSLPSATKQQPLSAAVDECRERYNFGADNMLRTTSGEEWTYGNYIYHHQEQGLPIIAITTTYDNNKPDCAGMQIDQKGEEMIAYVDYQPEKNQMRGCIDNEAKYCFMTFRKLLP